MLRSIFIASISMLVRIHALRVGNNRDDNTVTLKVEATDLTDSLYTLVQHMSDWNFGPELCLSDKCGTHLFSGYTLRITDGDWIIAGHGNGTRQLFFTSAMDDTAACHNTDDYYDYDPTATATIDL